MINGRLYLGDHSAAGELGHMSIAPSGPVCHCGNRGCLRTLCSESAVEANAIRIVKSGANTLLEARSDVENPSMTVQDVVNAAQGGDTVCIDIINDAARHLGMALVNLVNLLCPEVVVFNNGTLPSYPAFLEEVRRLISERSYSKDLGTPELRISSLGESAVCVGAACVVMDRILAEDRTS
jgi:glucokinase